MIVHEVTIRQKTPIFDTYNHLFQLREDKSNFRLGYQTGGRKALPEAFILYKRICANKPDGD